MAAFFGSLFLLFFIVIILVMLALSPLALIVGFVWGFLSTLAEADDTGTDHTGGRSSRKESSVPTGDGSNALEPQYTRSETVEGDSGTGLYETNEYGELVEDNWSVVSD